jgi:hypothetical protein
LPKAPIRAPEASLPAQTGPSGQHRRLASGRAGRALARCARRAPLGQWLADQGRDPRLRLSVVVRYAPAPGAREAALDHAAVLARMAGARAARVW